MDWQEDRSVFLSSVGRGLSLAAEGMATPTAGGRSRAAQQARFMQDCVPRGLPPLLPTPPNWEQPHEQ